MTQVEVSAKSKFDINEGASASKNVLLPNLPENVDALDITGYAQTFERVLGGGEEPMVRSLKALGIDPPKYEKTKSVSAKSLNAPPGAFNYGRISYAPDAAVNGGVVQWPGINPDSLRKVVRENIAPQYILGMRVDDVLRYSNQSTHLWRPGWRIDAIDHDDNDKAETKKDIAEACRFLNNSNIETSYTQARTRDSYHLTSFQKFLAAGTRDWLTFDLLAIWTDMDNADKVKAYALLPAGNVRFCTKEGFEGNPKLYAVAVDEGGRVIEAFTRDQLITAVRNPRTDPETFGYGYSEVEMAIRVIKGFQNALDMNIDIFDRSAIANGIITISGGAVTSRQLDLLTRMFTNMKKGITKWWALPVMGLPEGAKLELLDLTRLKGNEAYYKEFINMLAGALSTLWRFPVRRLGYKISGTSSDATPLPDSSVAAVDEDDPGLAPLLTHWEVVINEYLIATRWPHLRFRFTGKSPKEDAREYEARSLARTWKEARREAGLPPLDSIIKGMEKSPEVKLFVQLMELSPSDPNRSGIFQTVAAQIIKTMFGEGKDQKDAESTDGKVTARKDPATAQAHGHTAGVRRSD